LTPLTNHSIVSSLLYPPILPHFDWLDTVVIHS
jgi:hypothetical protein